MARVKKIAARRVPGLSPSLRVELAARALGFRTAAALQAGFRGIPAAPRITATRLDPRDTDGPAADLLVGLSPDDQRLVFDLGEHIVAKLLQERFRVAKDAPNRVRQIRAPRLAELGDLAGGALAARRIMAEARLADFAAAPLWITDSDIREAWIGAGVSAAPPRAEGVAAALLLALDLGLDADAIARLDAEALASGTVALGRRIVTGAGRNAAGVLDAWLAPEGRDGAALPPAMLHGEDSPTAIGNGDRCDPEALDALVFAATGSKSVGLGQMTLRDAAVASHLLLCTVLGKSVKASARRLGADPRQFQRAVTALGGKYRNRETEQSIATFLGVSRQAAAQQADDISGAKDESASAIDAFVESIDAVAEKRKADAATVSGRPAAPLVRAISKASEAGDIVEVGKSEAKALAAHIAAYFKARDWQMDFRPSLLSRPRNPLNVQARDVIEIAWSEGDLAADGASFEVDWIETHPVAHRRRLHRAGETRLDIQADGSVCLLTEAREGSFFSATEAASEGMRRRTFVEAMRSRLYRHLETRCMPFPLNIRGAVRTSSGTRFQLGATRLADALDKAAADPARADSFDPRATDGFEGEAAHAALLRQVQREADAIRDYAEARPLGVQPATSQTASRDRDRCAPEELPWKEPSHLDMFHLNTGHELRLRWRQGADPAHAHLSRDPYSPEERDWAQQALELAIVATAQEHGVETGDIDTALTAPNLATGEPAGAIHFGHPLASYMREIHDPEAPARIEAARAGLLQRLAPVATRLEKPAFVYCFRGEVQPLKLAWARTRTIEGDARLLDRRLAAHLDCHPAGTGAPGAR